MKTLAIICFALAAFASLLPAYGSNRYVVWPGQEEQTQYLSHSWWQVWKDNWSEMPDAAVKIAGLGFVGAALLVASKRRPN
jgi:hypothetical protein